MRKASASHGCRIVLAITASLALLGVLVALVRGKGSRLVFLCLEHHAGGGHPARRGREALYITGHACGGAQQQRTEQHQLGSLALMPLYCGQRVPASCTGRRAQDREGPGARLQG